MTPIEKRKGPGLVIGSLLRRAFGAVERNFSLTLYDAAWNGRLIFLSESY